MALGRRAAVAGMAALAAIGLAHADETPKRGGTFYNKARHETDPQKQHAAMFAFTKHVMDTKAHKVMMAWWYRIVPYRSYVKGWKISPSHYVNQDLAGIWLDQ